MDQSHQFSAEMIRHGQSGLAGFAASLMLEQHPEARDESGDHALSVWTDRLSRHLQELAIALEFGCSDIFLEHMRWETHFFKTRNLPTRQLKWGLAALSDVFNSHLPEPARMPALEILHDASLQQGDTRDTRPDDLDPSHPTDLKILRFLRLALQGNANEAVNWLLKIRDSGTPAEKIIGEIIVPVQRHVGERWHSGEISVYEEHLVTQIMFRAISAFAPKDPIRNSSALTVILASVEGNRHDMGTRILAHYVESMGWNTVLLGPDLPAAELQAAVRRFLPDTVMLSAALSIHMPALREATRAVREVAGNEVFIVAGGGALTGKKHLARELGVDLIADRMEEALTAIKARQERA